MFIFLYLFTFLYIIIAFPTIHNLKTTFNIYILSTYFYENDYFPSLFFMYRISFIINVFNETYLPKKFENGKDVNIINTD
jgi:hypothetical protein